MVFVSANLFHNITKKILPATGDVIKNDNISSDHIHEKSSSPDSPKGHTSEIVVIGSSFSLELFNMIFA